MNEQVKAKKAAIWARTSTTDQETENQMAPLWDWARARGLNVGRPEDKMGIRGSNTVPIALEGCRVQADALLGYFMDQGPRMQLQTGVKMGWTRLYDMAGVSTLSSAIIAINDWLKDAKNQTQLRRFLRASQRGWQYTFDNRDEAAEIFMKRAPAFNKEISLLEINGTMTILQTEKTKGKPIAWSASEDWKESQDLLEKYAKLKSQPDVNVYFSNEFLSEPPYLAKK